MNCPAVQHILDEIDRLSNEDREVLASRLEETLWRRDLDRMRAEALRRGIDEPAIDRALHEHRYGR
jgi:hypothetical protein